MAAQYKDAYTLIDSSCMHIEELGGRGAGKKITQGVHTQ